MLIGPVVRWEDEAEVSVVTTTMATGAGQGRTWGMFLEEMVRDVAPSPAGMRSVVRALAHLEIGTEVEAIEVLGAAEELKAAVAAVQARAAATFDTMRRNRQAANGLPTLRQGRGVAEEIALARRESPTQGHAHLRLGRALVDDMPGTLALMERGDLSEHRAQLVVKEMTELSPADRRTADDSLAPVLSRLSDRQTTYRARRLAQQLDADNAARRAEVARASRRVTLRSAVEPGMAYLTAHLPAGEAVRAYKSLTGETDSMIVDGDAGERTRGQLIADLLVERITGTGVSEPRDVDLMLVMTDETLLGGDDPAWVPGEGPLPGFVARGLLSEEKAKHVEMRRIWIEPVSGRVTKMDTRSRAFTSRLRALVLSRDDVCRSPFCGALIRQIDHARRHADGGATSVANASGLCQGCNLAKENAEWSHTTTETTLTVRTPTGHEYTAAPSHLADMAARRTASSANDTRAASSDTERSTRGRGSGARGSPDDPEDSGGSDGDPDSSGD